MAKKNIIRLASVVLAVLMPVLTVTAVFAQTETETATESQTKTSRYDSLDINSLTGMGQEPEDLSVSASAEYLEKAWYEYVIYSDKAVASYRLDDDTRLLFYDPYTYTNAMVMDVQFDATTTEFDTMSSYSVSKTTSKTISACVSSTTTDTSATQTSGRDVTHTDVVNDGETKTIYNHSIEDETSGTKKEYTDHEYIRKDYETKSTTLTVTGASETNLKFVAGVITEVEEKIVIGTDRSDTTDENVEWLEDRTTNTTEYSADYKTSTNYTGDDTVEYNTTSTTDGWTELSARVTKTLGSARSTSNSWSEEESVTVTKTYAATHFASDGVTPLPWAIVHYEVQMPMKVCMQIKHSGEWITISTVYSMLSTVKGTCRTWMQNGQVYYEDWGSGEPVVAEDFWAQFMTKEQLMNAYSNKLYPVGGEN